MCFIENVCCHVDQDKITQRLLIIIVDLVASDEVLC